MNKAVQVHELVVYLKGLLESDRLLRNVWVRGEISNFKLHSPSGHMYFSLKDEVSTVKCVMFRSRASSVDFKPEQGMKVIVRGYVSLYERDGQFQIYVEEMQPDGLGAIHLALEQLKNKLEKEGLFATDNKKQLPLLPSAIGVATSQTGAALRDILKVIYRRYPNLRVIIAPCTVQGEQAPGEIVSAIKRLNSVPEVELIIVGRGGGSREELWAFNSEKVVRAIAESIVPVISAVGHETDITLADMAADLRAPTPSAAAELAVKPKLDFQMTLKDLESRLRLSLRNNITSKRRVCELLATRPVLVKPTQILDQHRQSVDDLRNRLQQEIEGNIEGLRTVVVLHAGKLNALSPLAVMTRGYSISRKENGENIINSKQVVIGERINITLAQGTLKCSVEGAKS